MEGPREHALAQVGVGQDQVCGVHPTHRDDPHLVLEVGQQTLIRHRSATNFEGGRAGSDRQGEDQDGVIEVRCGVAQA